MLLPTTYTRSIYVSPKPPKRVAQKFHFATLRIEVTRASRGLSAIAELLVSALSTLVNQQHKNSTFTTCPRFFSLSNCVADLRSLWLLKSSTSLSSFSMLCSIYVGLSVFRHRTFAYIQNNCSSCILKMTHDMWCTYAKWLTNYCRNDTSDFERWPIANENGVRWWGCWSWLQRWWWITQQQQQQQQQYRYYKRYCQTWRIASAMRRTVSARITV